MMPLSSIPALPNAVVFPLAGVQSQPPKRPTVISQAVNRSATY